VRPFRVADSQRGRA